jgi:uncharacterized protein YukE
VSALDGFRAIWSQANAVFGEGAPGVLPDQGPRLKMLQDSVTSAGSRASWAGSAAESFAEANHRIARTIGDIAQLDQRLAAEIRQTAAVVTAGRRDLADVRRRVDDAASRVPATAEGERLLYPVISKGASDIRAIVVRAHADLASIAGRILDLGDDYRTLGSSARAAD